MQILCGFSANPQAPAHSGVGVDAHIDPAECTDFMEIYGEFVTSRRADVGIGPYKQVGSYGTNLPKVFRFSQLPAATSQALRASSS